MLSLRQKHHALTSCYLINAKPNLTECAKNYSGIKTLTVNSHAPRVVSNATLLELCLKIGSFGIWIFCLDVTEWLERQIFEIAQNSSRTYDSRATRPLSSCRYRRQFWHSKSANTTKTRVKMSFLWHLSQFASTCAETREMSASKICDCPCLTWCLFDKKCFRACWPTSQWLKINLLQLDFFSVVTQASRLYVAQQIKPSTVNLLKTLFFNVHSSNFLISHFDILVVIIKKSKQCVWNSDTLCVKINHLLMLAGDDAI